MEAGVSLILQKYLQSLFPNEYIHEKLFSRYFLHFLMTKHLAEYIVVFIGVCSRDEGEKH